MAEEFDKRMKGMGAEGGADVAMGGAGAAAVVGGSKDAGTGEAGMGVPAPKKRPGRDRYNALARNILGDKYSEEDEDANDNGIADYMERTESTNKRLGDAFNSDKRFAAALGDVLSKKRSGANAIARYFGKAFLDMDEDSDEYKDMMAGEEERLKEQEDWEKAQKEYEANLEKSDQLIKDFAAKNNIDDSDFRDQIYNKVLMPVLNGKYTDETLQILLQGLNYDVDMNSAKDAGRIEARNENIEQMRANRNGDGASRGMTSSKAKVAPPKPKAEKKRNPIFEMAAEA